MGAVVYVALGVVIVGVVIGLEARRYLARPRVGQRPDSNEQFALFTDLLERIESAAEDRPLIVAGFRDHSAYVLKVVHPSERANTAYIGMGPRMEAQRGHLVLEMTLPFRRIAEDHVYVDWCVISELDAGRFHSEEELRVALPVLIADIRGFRPGHIRPAA